MFSIAVGFSRALTLPMRYQFKTELINTILPRSFHAIQPLGLIQDFNNFKCVNKSSTLLASANFQYLQTCGLKHVGKVHRRCKDCYMMLREGVLYNYCKTHPRHNQKARTKRPKNTWTLTGVTQTKIRPW